VSTSKKMFLVWGYALGAALRLLSSHLSHRAVILHQQTGDNAYSTAIRAWGFTSTFASLFVFVILAVSVYTFWKAIQSEKGAISPIAAAGLMFVPVFNLYWFFRAIWGFARAYNRSLQNLKSGLPRLSEKLFAAFTILLFVRWFYMALTTVQQFAIGRGWLLGPYSYIITVPMFVLGTAVIYTGCDAVMAISSRTEGEIRPA